MSTQRNPGYGKQDVSMPMPVPTYSTYHEVTITKVTNGFIVRVGCMTFVTLDWVTVSRELGEYWQDPKAAQEKYQGKK